MVFVNTMNAMALTKSNIAIVDFYSEGDSMSAGFSETLRGKLNKLETVSIINLEAQKPVLNEMNVNMTQKFDMNLAGPVGKTLGADYILTGHLKEDKDKVNIRYQLFDVKSGAVVAEDGVKGNKAGIFELQGELAVKIANFFKTPVNAEIKQELYFMPTQNMSSFKQFSSGLTLYNKNRNEEAYNFFHSSVKGDTNFLDAHKYFEYSARKAKKLDEFVKIYEGLVAEQPDNPILLNYLGNGYFDKGNMVKAETLYKKSISIAPTFPNPYNNLAAIYLLSKQYETALGAFDSALKFSDKKATIYYNMGLCYTNMKDKEKAKACFAKALELEPKNPDFYIARRILYGIKIIVKYREKKVPGGVFGEVLVNSEPIFEIQDWAGGISPLDRSAIIAKRIEAMVMNGLKSYQIEVGRINNQIVVQTARGELIMTITEKIAKREGTTPEKLAKIKVNLLKEAMNKTVAESTTTGGVVLMATSYVITGNTLKELEGKVDTAKLQSLLDKKFSGETLENELKTLGFNPDERDMIRNITAKTEDVSNKETDMMGATDEATLLHKGDLYYGNGNMEEALKKYEEALKINPSYGPAYYSEGIIFYDKKDYDKALTAFSEAIKYNPESDVICLWLGKTHMEKGNKAEAKECFSKALKINPENSEAGDLLKSL